MDKHHYIMEVNNPWTAPVTQVSPFSLSTSSLRMRTCIGHASENFMRMDIFICNAWTHKRLRTSLLRIFRSCLPSMFIWRKMGVSHKLHRGDKLLRRRKKYKFSKATNAKKVFKNAIKQFLKFTKDKNASNICFYNCKKNESWWKLSDIYHNIDESVLICTKKK